MSPPPPLTCPLHPIHPNFQPLPLLFNPPPPCLYWNEAFKEEENWIWRDYSRSSSCLGGLVFREPEEGGLSFLFTTSSSLSFSLIEYRATTNTRSPPHPLIFPPLSLLGIFHCSLSFIYIYIALSQILSLLVLGKFVFLVSLSLYHWPVDIYTYTDFSMDSHGRGSGGGFNNMHHIQLMAL